METRTATFPASARPSTLFELGFCCIDYSVFYLRPRLWFCRRPACPLVRRPTSGSVDVGRGNHAQLKLDG